MLGGGLVEHPNFIPSEWDTYIHWVLKAQITAKIERNGKWTLGTQSVLESQQQNFQRHKYGSTPYPTVLLESSSIKQLCCQFNESLMILKENLVLLIIIRMPLGTLQDSLLDKEQSKFWWRMKQHGMWKSRGYYVPLKNVLWTFILIMFPAKLLYVCCWFSDNIFHQVELIRPVWDYDFPHCWAG